jgi:hypothetical protein
MTDPRGTGADEWGHGTHIAGIIAGAGTVESNGRGVAPGAHLVSVKVLDADGSGHISDVIAGIDWVIANRQRYQIDVINLSLGSLPEQSWRDDPVCQAIERAWSLGHRHGGGGGQPRQGRERRRGAWRHHVTRQLPVCHHGRRGEHEGDAVPLAMT